MWFELGLYFTLVEHIIALAACGSRVGECAQVRYAIF